jgi:hypothetical protein
VSSHTNISGVWTSLDGKGGKGVWEMRGSVRGDDRQAVLHENKISKEWQWMATAKVRETGETKRREQENIEHRKPIRKKGRGEVAMPR